MGHNKGKDNAKKRSTRRKKNDRLAMIMSGTPDIRYFTQNDQRFLAQF